MMINSVVKIYVPLCSGKNGIGVGFFVGPNHILTCRHVVDRDNADEMKSIRVSYGWAKYKRVCIAAVDYEHDLTLLYIPGKGGSPLKFQTRLNRKRTVYIGEEIKMKTFDKLWRGTRRGVVMGRFSNGFESDMRSVKGQSGSPAVVGRFGQTRVVGMLRASGLKTGYSIFIGVPEIKAFLAEYIK